jgi:hypothetical protein
MNRTLLLGSLCGVLIVFLILQLIGDGLNDPCGLAASRAGRSGNETCFQVGWQG